jgi:hypothetical protein
LKWNTGRKKKRRLSEQGNSESDIGFAFAADSFNWQCNSFLFPLRAAIQMHSNNMFRQSKQEHVSVAHELHPMIQIPITNAKHADASPSLGRMLIILGGDGDWSEP